MSRNSFNDKHTIIIKMDRIITKIEPKENLTLIATFADGEIVLFDVRTIMDKYPVFRALENTELFNSVFIDGIGYAVAWNDELDLSSDSIYTRGKHI